MTLFAMVVLNAVVFVAYWKVFKSIWGSLQTHGKALLSHIGGVLGGAALVGAASLGIGGAVVKSAAGGVAKATKATASGVAKASQAIDDRVGVTKKGASRAHKRAEEKARLREERKALWSIPMLFLEIGSFFGTSVTGGAWLSSARVVRCWVE